MSAFLTDENGKPVKGAYVGFANNGVKYFVTDAKGQAKYSTSGLAEGTYTVKVQFYGNDNYEKSNQVVTQITVKKIATKLESSDAHVLYHDGKGYLVATLKDANGKPVKGASVGFANNGVKYFVTDANGQAKYSTKDLAEGTYNVKICYYGNGTYAESNKVSAKIVVGKITTSLTSSDVSVNAGSDGYLVATLKDANGNPVKGASVGFANNGVKYFVTDANGQAKYSTKDLAAGTYNVKMCYYGNGAYLQSNQVSAKITVKKATTSKVATTLTSSDVSVNAGSDGYLVATLKDANGNPVKGASVGFANNGVKYFVTDANGQTKYSTKDLAAGTYNVKMAFFGNDAYLASNQVYAKITVKKATTSKVATTLSSSDVSVNAGSDGYLVATLKDANGNPVKGASVGFANNGVKYFVTDANGQAKYSTKNLAEGTYNVKICYYGNGTYAESNKVSAKIVVGKIATSLTSSDVHFLCHSDGYLVATLKDANGKPVKGASVGFANNGVKYIATNAKGQAKYSTKDLAEGTYNVKICYYGNGTYAESNKVSAKIVVGKIATSLTSSDSVVMAGSDGYLVATLKDANGNPVKGASVGFANNGVKYITTDANGQAKYRIKDLADGTYSVKMCYYGNDFYLQSNQVTVKIAHRSTSISNKAKIWINADMGSDAMKNAVANLLRKEGFTVHVGETYSNAHYTDYFKVTSDYQYYITLYNGFCAGTVREAYSSSIQNVLKSKGVQLVIMWDTSDWTNPQGMAPYKYGDFTGYNAKRAWDDNFSVGDPSINNVGAWLKSNNAFYCANPTAQGLVDQFLAGGYFAYSGK